MAIRERKLGFWLITALIIAHATAVIVLFVSAYLRFNQNNLQSLLAISLKVYHMLPTYSVQTEMIVTALTLNCDVATEPLLNVLKH